MIEVTVLITTFNEGENLRRCLEALKDFDQVIVIDSNSTDETISIAREYGVEIETFKWNGQYPKKRQWCLNNLSIRNDMIFFVDGDEEVTPELVREIKKLDFKKAGYFVAGQYQWKNKILHHGLQNNKLALFNKHKIEFPVVDDLGDFCMGEMEGHYQPVLKQNVKDEAIGQLKNPLRHFAYENQTAWYGRHQRYALWEAYMIEGDKYPAENNKIREVLKKIFRNIPFRGEVAFLHSYVYRRGFLDGYEGFEFACSRRDYYRMVNNALKTSKT